MNLKKIPAFIRLIILVFFINIIISLTYSTLFTSHAASMSDGNHEGLGEKLFKTNCSGCHLNGQNLIKPDKPIIGSIKLKSKQAFKMWLENPAPPMPNYKNIANMSTQLDALYNYVLSIKGK